jgi:dipeptidyl aminopeptidase/acylaminoacyl peptidase
MYKKGFYAGLILTGMLGCCMLAAQDVAYRLPPKEIEEIALAKLPPGVVISNDSRWLLLMDEVPFLSIGELSEPEYKLAGTRVTGLFGPSRREGYSSIRLLEIGTKTEYAIGGLPADVNILEAEWSPGSSHIALAVRERDGFYLWLVSVADRRAQQVSKRRLNRTGSQPGPARNTGLRACWLSETELIVPTVPASVGAFPEPSRVPAGPLAQSADGKAEPARTYQDLLKNPYDEQLFDYLFTSQLVRVSPGGETEIGRPAIHAQVSLSPDGRYLLATTVNRPYSYLVPMSSFPQTVTVLTVDGQTVQEVSRRPMTADGMGYDVSSPYPRQFGWRPDKPSTVYWTEALDGGNPRLNPQPFMDAVYQLGAPFDGGKELVVKTEFRCGGILWCDDAFALVREMSRRTRRVKTYAFAPGNPGQERTPVFDVSTDDGYADPGTPVMTGNAFNRKVIYTDKKHAELLMVAQGASPEGDMPYLSRYNLSTGKNTILWRCEAPYYETIIDVADPARLRFITARQSVEEPVNYFVRDAKKKTSDALTAFPNPYPQLKGMKVEKMQYKRADGLDLTATLYTPVGYDPKNGRLPVLMWAYPREYRSADDAAQVRGSKYMFTVINYRSPVYWVTRGFAVMESVEMPIVGDEGGEPNDSFLEQLTMNAEAATLAIHNTGVGDTSRMAVGGHSYGAFMTANLLTHTSLYKAGIARSGAYNRSLTPFGFQAETRTYWEAPDVYFQMSPFNYANRLSGALLLVHGEADNNTGTFPIQSERFFAAVKGHGGISRLVILPYESHSYSAKENILHLLYEVDAWLDKYVKQYNK